MPRNAPKLNPDRLKELNLHTLDFYFEFEPEFVFSYTPDILRSVCEESHQVARLLVLRMGDMLATTGDTTAITRPGFLRALTDRDWLQKMMALARGAKTFNYDIDETCYGELNGTSRANVAANEARCVNQHASATGQQCVAPELGHASGSEKQAHAEPRETEYFLRGFRKGQLHISNIITRSQILCVGSRRKGRRRWPEDAPLIVKDVSGFKADDVVISYIGQELRPADIVTWSTILFMASARPLGTPVSISKAKLLKARGGGDGNNSAKAAESELERLQQARFKVTFRCRRTIAAIADGHPNDESIQDAIKTGVLSLSFHLLGQISTSGRLWTIHIAPVVRFLFGKGISSWFDERIYRTIEGDFAKRLYFLYYSHTDCYPLTLLELKRYLGSTMTENSKFQDAMNLAHHELARKGVILDGWRGCAGFCVNGISFNSASSVLQTE